MQERVWPRTAIGRRALVAALAVLLAATAGSTPVAAPPAEAAQVTRVRVGSLRVLS